MYPFERNPMTKLAELAPRSRFDAKRALEQPPAHKDKYLIERCLPVCETTKESKE
jgi:hypothetical protein